MSVFLYSACSIPKGLICSPDSSSIDGEYEFNDVEDELATGDEFDSEEEEEMSMEVCVILSLISPYTAYWSCVLMLSVVEF